MRRLAVIVAMLAGVASAQIPQPLLWDMLSAATNQTTAGASKYAYHIASGNTYGRDGATWGLPAITNSVFSLAMWFKCEASDATLWSQWNTSPNRGIFVRVYQNKIGTWEYDGSYKLTTHTVTTADNGQWHFFAVSKSGTTNVVWMDGRATTNTSAPARYMNDGQFQLGSSTPNGIYWRGGMDECAIWDRALSDAEVRTLYNNSNGLPINVATAPYNSGVVAAWSMDDGTGTNMAYSIAGTNLTWNGGVWTNGYVQ